MRMHFFGDSYDVVKQSLLRWLRPLGEWSVHPMFTEEDVSPEDVAQLSRFLDAPLLSEEVLRSDVGHEDRKQYFAVSQDARNVFFDPDTGVCPTASRSKSANRYIFVPELVDIVRVRPDMLTLVFDQSVARGTEREDLQKKLALLAASGVFAFAYVSHACFVIAGLDASKVELAYQTIVSESRLPETRFVRAQCVTTTTV